LVITAALVMAMSLAAGDPTKPVQSPQSSVLASGARVIVLDQGEVVAQRPKGGGTLLLQRTAAARDHLSASVKRFFDRNGLLDIAVVERWRKGWNDGTRETHYIVDTSQPDDAIVCAFAGSDEQGGEYHSTATTIEIKKISDTPLAFDVTRTALTRASQPQPPPPPKTTTTIDHYKLGDASCAHTAPP
jgi:hypothetical protein